MTIITCKSGQFPGSFGPEYQNRGYDNNYFVKLCQEYFAYNYQNPDIHGGIYTQTIILVLMQGMQPFSNMFVQFFDYKPHTQIYKFYKCLNSDKTGLDFLNRTKFENTTTLENWPTKLQKYDYKSINLCKPQCAAIYDWQSEEYMGTSRDLPKSNCWDRKSDTDHGECWSEKEDFCFILGINPIYIK